MLPRQCNRIVFREAPLLLAALTRNLSSSVYSRRELENNVASSVSSPFSTAPLVAAPTQQFPDRLVDTTLSDVDAFFVDLKRAASWNHGQSGRSYDKTLWNPTFCRSVVDRYDSYLQAFTAQQARTPLSPHRKRLVSADAVNLALKALLKGHYDPPELQIRVRDWERSLGQLRQTQMTDQLSLRLVAANGKAGNVGRVLSLLQLRKQRNYKPVRREFMHAVTSLQSSLWAVRRSKRNPFLSDEQQAATDNPTRWLDAILLNMHQRQFPLDVKIAYGMLECYANGPTGKSVHHFYRVHRQIVASLPPDERPARTNGMPREWMRLQYNDKGYEMEDDLNRISSTSERSAARGRLKKRRRRRLVYAYQPIKVQLHFHRLAPPFYKIPSQVRGKLLSPHPNSTPKAQFKFERESEPDYSYPLSAAFSFCDSLQHGACGHSPIKLDTRCYNSLIKSCVQRGALWRAMNLIDQVMTAKSKPNTMSYNLLLAGLARVGDVNTAQDYYMKLLARGLSPDAFTVRSIVNGLLNLGDMSSAVTAVQDFFNQHSVLPPYTTHIKVLEFCLARDMVYEAKRYVSFLQQLWNWKPNKYHSIRFIKLMRATKANPQLHKESLQQLFAYFGEELKDSDF
jgi:pentatricopeptide repeat protein